MKKFNVMKFLFYISYILLIMQSMCTKVYGLNSFFTISKVLIIVNLILLTIISTKTLNIKSILFILVSVILGVLSFYVTDVSDVFYTIIFILAAKNIDIDDFVKKDFIIKISLMMFTYLCYKFGFAENVIRYRLDGTIRNSLGFSHPNRLGLYIFSVCLDLIYMHYKNKKWYDIPVLLISLFLTITICDSRSSQVGIGALMVLYFILPFFENKKWFNNLILVTPLLFFIISFILMYIYPNKSDFILTLDKLFTTRIKCMYEFYNYYNINLIGHEFKFYSNNSYSSLTALDNGYMHLIIHYGIIVFCYFYILLMKLIKKIFTEKKYSIYIYLIPILIYGLFERHIFEIDFNVMILLFSNIIFLKKIKGDE